MDYSEFSNFLSERVREKGLSAKHLSELTGVSVKNIEAIFSGDPKRLLPLALDYLARMGATAP